MKLSEIKPGEVFTIGETPSYPKLRTETGYIDMKDRIVINLTEITFDLRLMSSKELEQKFFSETWEIAAWIKECKENYELTK